MKTSKKVTCRPCKEQNNWEIQTPGGKVLPEHFATKSEAVKAGKKYAMEAGAELEVLNKTNGTQDQRMQNQQSQNQKQTRKASNK